MTDGISESRGLEAAQVEESPLDHNRRLADVVQRLKDGQSPENVTVREFLGWFGAQRRGYWVVRFIHGQLKKHGLVTVPSFEYLYIDAQITFALEPQAIVSSESEEVVVEGSAPDPTYRIGRLASANKVPVSVKPDAELQAAITLMLAYDFSQLPVMTNERELKGVVSWSSIGSRLALNRPCTYVRDAMEQHQPISAETSLFEAIDAIVADQYVLIYNSNRVICGIVTTSDLSLQFRQLGEPFLLLGEIENYIRRMIQNRFTVDELKQARDPGDTDREVSSAADLTFGEYLRLLENPDRWGKLSLRIDRGIFIKQLDQIRTIRNDVMHFDPDGIPESDVSSLRNFAALMQQLANMGAI